MESKSSRTGAAAVFLTFGGCLLLSMLGCHAKSAASNEHHERSALEESIVVPKERAKGAADALERAQSHEQSAAQGLDDDQK